MGRPRSIDRDLLHKILWRRRDRLGRLQVKHSDLATELGISVYHFSRIMTEFVEDGRLKILTAHGTRRTYLVVDPAEWQIQTKSALTSEA